jgi:Hydrazine synthase alpha subunit middle domain
VNRTNTLTLSLTLALTLAQAGCESGGSGQGPLDGVDSIVFLQRPARGGMGDIFNYTSYLPGARLVKLSPPTADGELTVLCCDKDEAFADADISGYDLSFDAREIVFSAKLSGNEKFGLYIVSLETGDITPIPTDPNQDYITPAFLPGDRIFFATNAVVEDGAPQFRDEYERRETAQVGVINRDGSNETLGARNLSHRIFPTVLSDGRVMVTHWDHLGDMNAGHLVIMNPDMTRVREAFGKQDTGFTNSYYKAVEVSPGRVIAIGSSRDRTVQSGTIIDIRLGTVYEEDGQLLANRDMAEANASYRVLTPQVPSGEEPSFPGVGRYYDAYPLNAKDYPDLLVSWANGPVEDGSLDAAGVPADFGIYLYDSKGGQRRPIWNQEEYWDVFPRPLAAREAPPVIPASATNDVDENAVLIGSTNVYQSSLDEFAPGSIYGVRVLEGFSSEEGLPRDFGLTEHEGSARLGVAQVQSDGSWAALIPANVPVHVQVLDEFGMSLRSEPVWISGRKGESLLCNGCHEDRARAAVIQPGLTEALLAGPVDMMSATPRNQRKSDVFSIDGAVGVPWDKALQPIFDAKCVSCHDGDASKAGNRSYTITDPETGESFTWTFNLSSEPVEYDLGEEMLSGYMASHMSLLGPSMLMIQEENLVIDGEIPVYVTPNEARNSELIKKLNPPRLYPTPDETVRAFEGMTHAQEQGFTDLTPEEYHLLILMSDGGGQYYSRENPPVNPVP